jgi:hypothetical protein
MSPGKVTETAALFPLATLRDLPSRSASRRCGGDRSGAGAARATKTKQITAPVSPPIHRAMR